MSCTVAVCAVVWAATQDKNSKSTDVAIFFGTALILFSFLYHSLALARLFALLSESNFAFFAVFAIYPPGQFW